MESLSSIANKRKKRKSRKCLDEIRKRSRRTGHNILIQKDKSKVCDLLYNSKNNNNHLITNNRLTLRMFPKAIRSETITRPAIVDIKQKTNLNFNDLMKGTKICTLSSTRERFPELISSLVDLDNNAVCDIVVDEEHLLNQDKNIKEKFNILTSVETPEITDKSPESYIPMKVTSQSASTVISPKQDMNLDFSYSLYEEFMSEIPIYLEQIKFANIEGDVMKKTKIFLHDLFIESCYQECEDNVVKCIKNSTTNKIYFPPSAMIVHNPLDYIRLGHVEQQHILNGRSRLSESMHDSCSTSQSSSPATSSDTPLSTIIHETPPYPYYPHRLN